jgi:hypothetical protein
MQPVQPAALMMDERSVIGLLASGVFIQGALMRFLHPGCKPERAETNAERLWKRPLFLPGELSGARQRMRRSGDRESSLRI